MWTYATCGMSARICENALEIHLFSPVQAEELVELLTAVVHYHCTGAPLGLGHTVNFGRPWLAGSRCSFGLVSLPYLDGPDLEAMRDPALEWEVRCLWLIPITGRELQFKKERGLEALEDLFQAAAGASTTSILTALIWLPHAEQDGACDPARADRSPRGRRSQ